MIKQNDEKYKEERKNKENASIYASLNIQNNIHYSLTYYKNYTILFSVCTSRTV